MSDGQDYRQTVRAAALDEQGFLGLTLSRLTNTKGARWQRIRVRPVTVKGRRHLQFSYFDGTRYTTKNAAGDDAAQRLDEALALPFGEVHVQTASGDLHVKVTKKGRVLVSHGKPSRPDETPNLEHDREKEHVLPADPADPLLRALGIVAPNGAIASGMQGKFHQINEFLRIVDQVVGVPGPATEAPSDSKSETRDAPLEIVDCGCGSAHLTFAAYHHLAHRRGVAAHVTGVDLNAELIAKCERLRDSLGWHDLDFQAARIAEFEPGRAPDIVLSLHACDTATDEALARGVRWRSRAILAAPCCQHELHHRLSAAPLGPVLHHGILRERLADIVTDTFRALALRVAGYRTSIVEFVSPDRTAKNLLIRAERGLKPGQPQTVAEYAAFKAFWNVTPAIEAMLGEDFERLIRPEP